MTADKGTQRGKRRTPALPGGSTPGRRVMDQEEIDVYVRIGYRKRKIRLLILESICEIMDIGMLKEENTSGNSTHSGGTCMGRAEPGILNWAHIQTCVDLGGD